MQMKSGGKIAVVRHDDLEIVQQWQHHFLVDDGARQISGDVAKQGRCLRAVA